MSPRIALSLLLVLQKQLIILCVCEIDQIGKKYLNKPKINQVFCKIIDIIFRKFGRRHPEEAKGQLAFFGVFKGYGSRR